MIFDALLIGLFGLLFSIYINHLFIALGLLLYYCGLKKFGFRLVVMGDVFGFKDIQKWLIKHCPFDNDYKCKYWSCKNSPNCPKSKWYGKNK